MIEPYRRPKSFTPLVSIYVAAFYTGVIAAAINEQLYKVDSNSNSCFFIHLLQSCIFILTLSNIDLELMVFWLFKMKHQTNDYFSFHLMVVCLSIILELYLEHL